MRERKKGHRQTWAQQRIIVREERMGKCKKQGSGGREMKKIVITGIQEREYCKGSKSGTDWNKDGGWKDEVIDRIEAGRKK